MQQLTAEPYIETGCIFKHEGKEYESGGAVIFPEVLVIAYLGPSSPSGAYPYKPCGDLQDWHGKKIGRYIVTATWKTPGSFASSTMHQVEATVDGVVYTGRSGGPGMLYRGRAKAKQPKVKPC